MSTERRYLGEHLVEEPQIQTLWRASIAAFIAAVVLGGIVFAGFPVNAVLALASVAVVFAIYHVGGWVRWRLDNIWSTLSYIERRYEVQREEEEARKNATVRMERERLRREAENN